MLTKWGEWRYQGWTYYMYTSTCYIKLLYLWCFAKYVACGIYIEWLTLHCIDVVCGAVRKL
jgi:hypothetical protein